MELFASSHLYCLNTKSLISRSAILVIISIVTIISSTNETVLNTTTTTTTTNPSAIHAVGSHHHHYQHETPIQIVKKSIPNQWHPQPHQLPVESRIQQGPTTNERRAVNIVAQQLVPISVLATPAQQQQQQQQQQPIAPRSPSTPALPIAPSVPAKQRNDLLTTVYRGARDTLGGLVNVTSSMPLGNVASAVILFGGVFLASPLVMPEIKRSLAGVTNFEERFGFQSRIDSFVSWVERSVEDLPAFPRLHPQECIKRAVCEVNHNSKKYGLPGLVLQVMFPPQLESEEPSRVVNKYKVAASYGKFNTSNDPEGCKTKYEECIVNLLEIVQNLMGLFLN